MTDNNTDELERIEKKYGHLLVVGASVLLIIAVIVGAFISRWFALRLQSDFWPIDKATVAPNILASIIQAVVVVTIMAIFYPPFRKALDRAATKHKDDLKAHITNELASVHERHDEVERMLNHVITHSKDIPPLPPKEIS
jgi:uncharacterized membrane-anchored protein YitT (DUF2179 family)